MSLIYLIASIFYAVVGVKTERWITAQCWFLSSILCIACAVLRLACA